RGPGRAARRGVVDHHRERVEVDLLRLAALRGVLVVGRLLLGEQLGRSDTHSQRNTESNDASHLLHASLPENSGATEPTNLRDLVTGKSNRGLCRTLHQVGNGLLCRRQGSASIGLVLCLLAGLALIA